FVLANKAPIPEDIKAKIAYELGKVCVDLAEGQTMDISFEKREDVTVEEYMEMIRLKTGALFRTSAKVGGLAAGADDNELSKLEEYGEKLGIAFQIADDILGLVGEKDKLGKPVGSDIREGKKTYLVLYAREHLDTNDAKRLMTILNKDKKSDMEINEAIELVKRSGALDQAKTLAQSIADDAIKALNIFPESDARKDLEILARLAVERTY
ncbi:MAG: polyprenyl synthetase family protein, partial [Candidatus Njordarchaeum guaymaensis]